jgi:two-component system CheB/CheR fusion protein
MPLSVLIVEDHPDGAESLAKVLGLYGYEARVARNGDKAVKAVDDFPADVVILDIGLPGMNGFAVAKKLCEVSKRRPLLVAVTGYGNMEARARSEGFDHHFIKPVDPCVLSDLLKSHADRSAGAAG